MNRILIVLVLVLNLIDLILSYLILSPQSEANPLMKYLWERGFIFVVLFKLGMTGLAFSCLYLIRHTNRFRIALVIINLILVFTICRLIQYHLIMEASKKEIQGVHEQYIQDNPVFE